MDDTTKQFEQFAGRAPRDGDFYAEEPTKVFDPERGHLVSIRQCWQYQDGRWEGLISIGRGAAWGR